MVLGKMHVDGSCSRIIVEVVVHLTIEIHLGVPKGYLASWYLAILETVEDELGGPR